MNKLPYKKVLKFSKVFNPQASTEERPQSSNTTQSRNSFLVEIDHNYDIDNKIRNEIEHKFKRSLINSYKFPRSSIHNNKPLPKIRTNKKHLSDFDGNSNIKKYIIKFEKKNRKDFENKYKSKHKSKKNRKDKKSFSSATPSPYVFYGKNKNNSEIKRFTPSPVYRNNMLTIKIEKSFL